MKNRNILSTKEVNEILNVIKARFEKNRKRHKSIEWVNVQSKLMNSQEKLWSLYQMEITGGEPDVVGFDEIKGEFIFYDCSAESPQGRRSICYDREGLESRKDYNPGKNAVDMAAIMGIELLTEEQYKELQQVGTFDTKTSSWIKTPAEIRKLGGALFAEFRYGQVFIFHNSAPSYYAARGFRGILRV